MNESTPSMGMNRTGMQMSPLDGQELQDATQSLVPCSVPDDDSAIRQIRGRYIAAGGKMGSVPIPGTLTGAVTTGMSMLTGQSPHMLIDKLGERMAFERTGTRLYDAVLTKLALSPDSGSSITEEALRTIRNQELAHFSLVASAIESIGGDPTAQTPCADLVGVESLGLMQVVSEPRTSLAQSLHALLVAELNDNSGWETLIALADAHGQQAMVENFTQALNQEREHLRLVQHWINELTLGAAPAEALRTSATTTAEAAPSQSIH